MADYNGIKVLGTGAFLPRIVATNEDFTEFVETSDEWISTRTGMKERHIATTEPTWYMGTMAARQALQSAGVDGADLDMIIATTVTNDYDSPSLACLVQREIGAPNAFGVDVNVACTGLAYTLDMARRYLMTGMKRILLVGAESLTQITNYEDRATCVLFGDGAGALVVEAGDGIFGAFNRSDTAGLHHLYAKKTRRNTPFTPAGAIDEHETFKPVFYDALYMNGKEVYKFAVKAMPMAVEEACKAAGITVSDLDLIIPHQANLRIIETAMKNLKLPMEKAFVNIHKYANNSSATIPIALHEVIEEKWIKRGDKVCLVGMGAGLTYGASAFEY